MIGLPNPKFILIAVIAYAAAYGYGHHKGWWERDMEMQVEIAAKNEEARAKEQQMQQQLNNQTAQLMEANNAVSKKQSDLDRLINAGRVRLPTSSCVQTAPSAGAAPSNSPETTTESEREVLRLIAEITADGDKAINQLNACIDAYNQVKETINGKR